MRKLSLLLTLFSLLACRSPRDATQTVIKIRASDEMQSRIARYTTRVFTLPQNQPLSEEEPPTDVVWPIKRTFIPESDSLGQRFRYVFSAFDETGAVVSTLDIETEIVPGASRYLYILLTDACLADKCQDGVCKDQVPAAELRTSPAQAQALEGQCASGSLMQPPMDTGAAPPEMTGENTAGRDAPTGQNNTSTGTAPTNPPAADGGVTGTPNSDAGMPSTTEACSGAPCGEGDCILNSARATGYECRCKSGFEPNEEGSTCVVRDDCAKPDKGGCEDICTTTSTGEGTCSCKGPNRWLKADGKQCAEVNKARELSLSGGSLVRTRPQIAFDPAGNGVVVWTENSAETGYALWTARFRADTKKWEPATRFQRFTNEAADLHLALDASGSGVVMWTATVNSKRQLWAKRYRDGAFGPTVQQVDSDSEGDVLTPSIALDATGDGLAVWTDTLYPRSTLRVARYYASSDTFEELVNVLDTADRFVFGTSVAVSNLTGGLVAWTDMGLMMVPDAGSVPDFTKLSARSSRVETSLNNGLAFASTLRSTSPDVVLDEHGNGVAVWVQAAAAGSSMFEVVSRIYVPGMGWEVQRPHTLSARGAMFSTPRVAIGSDGTSFAVWREGTGTTATAESPSTSVPLQTYGAVRTEAGFGASYELGLPSLTATWNDIDTTTWTPETTVALTDMLQPSWSTAVGPNKTGFIAGASFTTSVAPVERALWLQRIGPEAEPTELIALNDGDTVPSRPSPVKLGMNANGDGAVVWDQQVDGLYHVFVNLLD